MGEKWLTRKSLLMRAKDQDDDQAWQDFVDYYGTFIEMLLSHFRFVGHDRDDLKQEILLKIWKNLDKYDTSRSNFRGWLNRLIRNQMIDYKRKQTRLRKRETTVCDDDGNPVELAVSEDRFTEVFEEEWRTHLTNVALKNVSTIFSGKAMEVFDLCLDGKSIKEVAAQLELAESSVYKLRQRVEQRLIAEVRRLRDEVEL